MSATFSNEPIPFMFKAGTPSSKLIHISPYSGLPVHSLPLFHLEQVESGLNQHMYGGGGKLNFLT